MRNTILLCLGLLCTHFLFAQKQHGTIKWAPLGLFFGSLTLQGEYNLKDNRSFTVKAGFPVAASHDFTYHDRPAHFTTKGTSAQIGFRTYLSKDQPAGLYLEPYVKYLLLKSEGYGQGNLMGQMVNYDFTNRFEGNAFGIQLGVQIPVKERWVIDLFFFGPEINVSLNSFGAAETTNERPWTAVQAWDAKRDISDFLRKFPFVKNRFDITVDAAQRKVDANFVGTLPGIRTGVSVGFAF